MTGFTTPLLHSPRSAQGAYPYRSRTAIVGGGEWSVHMDDFYQQVTAADITNGAVANTPVGWDGAIIDSGSTVTVNTTTIIGATGVLTFADASASEGATIYGTKSIQLTAGKRFWMETRTRVNNVNDIIYQFGLAGLTAVVNPEDLWTTTENSFIAFGILDGTTSAVSLTCDKTNQAPTTDTSAATGLITSNVFMTYAFYYDGGNAYGYLNGSQVVGPYSVPTKIPNGIALAPFIGCVNGNGGGGSSFFIDYIRWCSER